MRTEEVDEDRWIRGQMSLLNRHFQCLLLFSRVMPDYNNKNSFFSKEHAEVQPVPYRLDAQTMNSCGTIG